MICYKNKVIFKKLIYFIPSKELEDCMISSKGRLLERGMPIHVSIMHLSMSIPTSPNRGQVGELTQN